jgi:hypothetical protein
MAEPGGVVLDLTPGNKEMSLVLAFDAARPGNWLYYLRHERKGERVEPFSERPLIWSAGERGRSFLARASGRWDRV